MTLGAVAQTDVFELILRRPQSGEYIPDGSDEGRSVAMTLAVALRRALAGVLGVSAAELGYSIRPVKLDNEQSVLAIQLYDVISGGAGFASSAPLHIDALLRGMVKQLGCSHCDTACSECLLDSQTRHDHDALDRKAALAWLGEDFTHYIGLPEEEKLSLVDAQYCPGSIEDAIRRVINEGATSLTVWLNEPLSEWDLYASEFRRAILRYRLTDNLDVTLVIPAGITDADVLGELAQFAATGIRICCNKVALTVPVIAQLLRGESVITLATRDMQAAIPGSDWHQTQALVVRSQTFAPVELDAVDLARWSEPAGERVKDLSLSTELNGPIAQFGRRFWAELEKANEETAALLKNNQITRVYYTDRYIQNPAALVLLGSIMNQLKPRLSGHAQVAINTLFKAKEKPGFKAAHDWANEDDFQGFAEQWFTTLMGKPVDVTLNYSNRDIPHHRKLLVEFDNGKALKIRFDQGMGYWSIQFRPDSYNFMAEVEDQIFNMARSLEQARVSNKEERWPTDVLVEIQQQ